MDDPGSIAPVLRNPVNGVEPSHPCVEASVHRQGRM